MIGVIGGCGFLGTSFCRLLDEHKLHYVSYDLDPTDKAKLIDVEHLDANKLKDVNTLINLAAVHRDDVKPLSRYDDVNVKGARNVCDAARELGINKIIFTSSVAVYGFAESDIDENGEIGYFSDYGRTKYEAEIIYKQWQAEDPENRSLVIVRPTVIFGPGNRGNVYNLLNLINSRLFIMFGDGENKKSMAYVENVAAFLLYSMKFGVGVHLYNYIDKPDFSMNELVAIARRTLFGKSNLGPKLPAPIGIFLGGIADFMAIIIRRPLPVSGIRVKKFMATTQFSSSVKETDFKPPYSLADGLVRTLKYEFIENNKGQKVYFSE